MEIVLGIIKSNSRGLLEREDMIAAKKQLVLLEVILTKEWVIINAHLCTFKSFILELGNEGPYMKYSLVQVYVVPICNHLMFVAVIKKLHPIFCFPSHSIICWNNKLCS